MRSKPRFIPGVFLILLFATAVGLCAQAPVLSSIKGHVTGPGGIAVPGARVFLVNPRTRQRKETWTDAAGNYVFASVSPGTYRIFVILVGFRPAMKGPFTVEPGKPAAEGATLALAMPGESAGYGASRFGARRGQTGAQHPGSQNLAMRGRLGAGNPGARLGGESVPRELNGGGTGVRFSGNGADSGGAQPQQGSSSGLESSASASNSFVLTGNVVDATAPPQRGGGGWRYRRFAQDQTAPGVPGFGGGAERFQNMVFFFGAHHRPGVNRIRGNAFDSYSNSALDARPYPLNTPSQPQIPYYSERAGISLGGPLTIPKIYPNGKDKTSFFVHYSTIRSTSPFNLFDTVPTLAERAGDFSQTTIASGPLAGTVPTIYEPPSNRLGPRIPFPGNVIPSPMFNKAALGLLRFIPAPNLSGEVQNLHLQEALPTHDNFIMGRVGHEISAKDNLSAFYFYNSSLTEGINNFPSLTSTGAMRNQNLNLMETHTFGPTTINMLGVNFNRSRDYTLNPFAFTENVGGGLGITGISQDPMDWGIPQIGFTNFTGLNDTVPALTRNQTFRFSDYVILNRAKHNLHVGGDLSKLQLNSLTDPNANGTFSFTGYTTSNFTPQGVPVNGTGYDFADFLLGLPQTTSVRFGTSANYLRSSAYDAFANDDWRVLSHLTLDLGGRWEYDAPFTEKYGHLSDLALGPGYSTVGVITGQNSGALPASLLRGHTDNVAPRFGLAYRPWLAHSLVIRAGYGIFYDESIYSQIVSNLTSQPPFATTSTLVTNPQQILTLENGFPVTGASVTRNSYAVDPNFLTPYAQTWDVILEQDLRQNFVLSAAYVGTHGTHLNLLLAPVGAITPSGKPLLTNSLPYIYDTSGAASIYNGLRVSLRHFSHNGLMFFANYTYSKSMDDAASVGGAASVKGARFFGGMGSQEASGLVSGAGTVAQDPFNLQPEWGLSSFNPTQSLRFFTRYQLPFGEKKQFLNRGGALTKLFGNWSLSGNATINSGTPLTALLSGNLSNNVSGSAPFSSLRADSTGVPVLPTGFTRTPLEYFNTAAFTLPPAGEYGNAGRNTIPGPPEINFNASVDRQITISRERGLNADFRLSADNLFNTVNFTSLATTVNANTFGRVTGAGDMRSLSLSVRLRF